MRVLPFLLAATLLLALPLTATAQPDPFLSILWSDPGVVVVCPGGDGRTLAEAGVTVHLQLVDYQGVPVEDYDPGDLVLSEPWAFTPALDYSCDPHSPARRGFAADGPTDADGETTFSGTAALGGSSTLGLTAKVFYGMLPTVSEVGIPPVDVRVTSPDLTGDGEVSLPDFGEFGLLFGSTDWRADFVPDGVVNLSDFGYFGLHFGHGCN